MNDVDWKLKKRALLLWRAFLFPRNLIIIHQYINIQSSCVVAKVCWNLVWRNGNQQPNLPVDTNSGTMSSVCIYFSIKTHLKFWQKSHWAKFKSRNPSGKHYLFQIKYLIMSDGRHQDEHRRHDRRHDPRHEREEEHRHRRTREDGKEAKQVMIKRINVIQHSICGADQRSM